MQVVLPAAHHHVDAAAFPGDTARVRPLGYHVIFGDGRVGRLHLAAKFQAAFGEQQCRLGDGTVHDVGHSDMGAALQHEIVGVVTGAQHDQHKDSEGERPLDTPSHEVQNEVNEAYDRFRKRVKKKPSQAASAGFV